jgi:integrase
MPKRTHDGLVKDCGCPEKQWTRCVHPWAVRFHANGKAHFISLHKYAQWPRGKAMPKTEAIKLRDKIRGEIRDGHLAALKPTSTTVGAVLDAYREQFVRVPTRRPHACVSMEGHLAMVERLTVPDARGRQVPFAGLAMRDVTPATVESLRHARRQELAAADAAHVEVQRLEAAGKAVPSELRQRARLRTRGKGGEVGINRMLARLRHLFSWAIARYPEIEQHPFRKAGVAVVKLAKETARSRRLRPGEEDALIANAGFHLKALILAGLATGARIGELLSLQWWQVERDAKDTPIRLRLVADKTKTSRTRILPVPRVLAAVLEMRQTAPDGQRHAPDTYVFGNEVGEQVDRVQTAWETCCRAAGIEGLHFHDLRREFGSRLLDSGVPLTTIQTYLGHTSVTTTAKYLEADQLLVATAVDAIERNWSDERICSLFVVSPETTDREVEGVNSEVLDSEGVEMVPRARIELATLRFSVVCSTN